MDSVGDTIGNSFWASIGVAATMIWEALTANPWILVLLVLIIAASLWMQLTPTRRRRRN